MMLTDTLSFYELIRLLGSLAGVCFSLMEFREGTKDIRVLGESQDAVLRAIAYGRRTNSAITASAQACLLVSAAVAANIPGPREFLPGVSNVALMLVSLLLLHGGLRRRRMAFQLRRDIGS